MRGLRAFSHDLDYTIALGSDRRRQGPVHGAWGRALPISLWTAMASSGAATSGS